MHYQTHHSMATYIVGILTAYYCLKSKKMVNFSGWSKSVFNWSPWLIYIFPPFWSFYLCLNTPRGLELFYSTMARVPFSIVWIPWLMKLYYNQCKFRRWSFSKSYITANYLVEGSTSFWYRFLHSSKWTILSRLMYSVTLTHPIVIAAYSAIFDQFPIHLHVSLS